MVSFIKLIVLILLCLFEIDEIIIDKIEKRILRFKKKAIKFENIFEIKF